jgi:hypothetical protein
LITNYVVYKGNRGLLKENPIYDICGRFLMSNFAERVTGKNYKKYVNIVGHY